MSIYEIGKGEENKDHIVIIGFFIFSSLNVCFFLYTFYIGMLDFKMLFRRIYLEKLNFIPKLTEKMKS